VNRFDEIFEESISLKKEIVGTNRLAALEKMGAGIVSAICAGNKLLLCGNGGSAADAQHLAAELLVRLRAKNNRKPVAAMALAQDTSTLTACANDFSYDDLYSRMVEAFGNKGDVLLGITTSGDSVSVIRAMETAKDKGLIVYGFLGSDGGKAKGLSDVDFIVPSINAGRVQEIHITAGHSLMEYVEDELIRLGYLHIQ